MIKFQKKIRTIVVLCCAGIACMALALQRNSSLRLLQQEILDATNSVPKFDVSIPRIIKEGAIKLQGDKERFEKLIFTMDDDNLTIIAHLVLEYDPSELEETITIIQKFFGGDYKKIAQLMRYRDDNGRSPLYYAVLRKRDDMVNVLLEKAKEIFGQDKTEFLKFINGENDKGQRESSNYRTPFILAAYNDDEKAVRLLIRAADQIFGKGSQDFKEFTHARDSNGAIAGFYAGDKVIHEAQKHGVVLTED